MAIVAAQSQYTDQYAPMIKEPSTSCIFDGATLAVRCRRIKHDGSQPLHFARARDIASSDRRVFIASSHEKLSKHDGKRDALTLLPASCLTLPEEPGWIG
jgi:hypothetical protein